MTVSLWNWKCISAASLPKYLSNFRAFGKSINPNLTASDLAVRRPTAWWIKALGSSALALYTLQRRHNGHDSVSNHQSYDSLLNRLYRRRSKKTLKLRVTGLCEGNSPVTGEFLAQMASNADNVSVWRRHHEKQSTGRYLNQLWQNILKQVLPNLKLSW